MRWTVTGAHTHRSGTPALRRHAVRLGAALVLVAGLAGAADRPPPPDPCKRGPHRQRVTLVLSVPETQAVVSAVLSLTYDRALMRLPATGGGNRLRKRLTPRGSGVMLTPANAGDGLRVVAAKAGGLPGGPLVDIVFDRCAGARPPAPADLRCTVASCAGAGGQIDGCICTVALP